MFNCISKHRSVRYSCYSTLGKVEQILTAQLQWCKTPKQSDILQTIDENRTKRMITEQLFSLPRGLFCSVTYKRTKRHLEKDTEIVLRNMM